MEASAYAYAEDGFGGGGVSPQEAASLASMPVDVDANAARLLKAAEMMEEMLAAGLPVEVLVEQRVKRTPMVGVTQSMKEKIFCAAMEAVYQEFREAEKVKAQKEKAAEKAKKEMGLSGDSINARALGKFRRGLAKKAAKKAAEAAEEKAAMDQEVAAMKSAVDTMLWNEGLVEDVNKTVLRWKLEAMLEAGWSVYELLVRRGAGGNVCREIAAIYVTFRESGGAWFDDE